MCCVHVLVCALVGMSQYNAAKHTTSDVFVPSAMVTATGVITVMNLWITLLPTSKSSVWKWVVQVPFERRIKYHKIVALLMVINGVMHFVLNLSYQKLYTFNNITSMDMSRDVRPFFGLMALCVLVVMAVMSLDFFRRLVGGCMCVCVAVGCNECVVMCM